MTVFEQLDNLETGDFSHYSYVEDDALDSGSDQLVDPDTYDLFPTGTSYDLNMD